MAEHLYVATGADGVERALTGEIAWQLPSAGDGKWTPGGAVTASSGALVLRRAHSLLEALDERVFHAEALTNARDEDDRVTASTARLTDETAWDVEAAARFALACAAHSLVGAKETSLPDGTDLVDVVAEAAGVLERAGSAGDERLGFLARLAAVRRLRRLRGELSDASLTKMTSDLGEDLDTLDDPAWTQIAACSEAVLAALEALRHVAAPRYVGSREETVDEHPDGAPGTASIVMTPWGPVALGAEHRSPYEPAWTEARDAAMRARESAEDRGGKSALNEESIFQATLLEAILEGERPPVA